MAQSEFDTLGGGQTAFTQAFGGLPEGWGTGEVGWADPRSPLGPAGPTAQLTAAPSKMTGLTAYSFDDMDGMPANLTEALLRRLEGQRIQYIRNLAASLYGSGLGLGG